MTRGTNRCTRQVVRDTLTCPAAWVGPSRTRPIIGSTGLRKRERRFESCQGPVVRPVVRASSDSHGSTVNGQPKAFSGSRATPHRSGCSRSSGGCARLGGCGGYGRRLPGAVEAAGLEDVTPHDLRATHATWVADSHGILVAARRLGHANASVTTRHYARPVDGRDADVAKHLDKLGKSGGERSGTHRACKPRTKES
jgi:hypothetical protein